MPVANEVYAAVLTVVFGIVCLIGTVEIYRKRAHPFIKCRNPTLLIIQCLGTLASCTLQTLYIAMKPHYSCYAFYFGVMCAFAVVAFPMGIRIWEYCVQLHLALLRTKLRSNIQLERGWEQQHWFFRNKWAGSSRFLKKLFFFCFWIWLIPVIPGVIMQQEYAYTRYELCDSYKFSGSIFISVSFALFYLVFALIASILTWGVYDAYRIKTELKYIVAIWIITFAVWIPYTFISVGLLLYLPACFWIVLGLYATFCATAIWPLILVHHETKMKFGKGIAGFNEFIDELEFLPFRNTFFEYLTIHLCQENLLFYEAVMDWKRMLPTNPARAPMATKIYDTFIDDTGLCQINIDSRARDAIEAALQKSLDELQNDVFDGALATVLGHMHTNSYHAFKNKTDLISFMLT